MNQVADRNEERALRRALTIAARQRLVRENGGTVVDHAHQINREKKA